MKQKRARSLLRTGPVLALLAGTVLAPAIGTLAVGIVALALWQRGTDIVFGVLALVFAVMAVTGGLISYFMLRRSERFAQMQADFVATVSHELRTPLAGIRLMTETIERGRADTPERRAEVVGLLHERVERLEELVESILRWRQLDRGKAHFELVTQPVGPLVESAVGAFPQQVESGRLQIDVAPALPPVRADGAALTDAVRNLLENAVKYGRDDGSIEVVVRSDGDDVVVEVRDEGPGIPRRERRRIFERFYRVPVHMRSKQGVGLGLAIVRQIVEAHGGTVEVESEPGIGSAFIIRVPIADEPIPGPTHAGAEPVEEGAT